MDEPCRSAALGCTGDLAGRNSERGHEEAQVSSLDHEPPCLPSQESYDCPRLVGKVLNADSQINEDKVEVDDLQHGHLELYTECDGN